MTLYIDDALILATVGTLTSRWSHLMSDLPGPEGTAELVSFAVRLGMRREWIQYEGTWKEHFDLTTSKRLLALRRGAVALHGIRETAALSSARREGQRLDLAAVRLGGPVLSEDGDEVDTLF